MRKHGRPLRPPPAIVCFEIPISAAGEWPRATAEFASHILAVVMGRICA